MKKLYTIQTFLIAVAAMLVLPTQKTKAQQIDVVGYMPIYTQLVAVPTEGGEACATLNETGLKLWNSEFNFKQPVSVNRMTMDVNGTTGSIDFIMYFLYARPKEGYVFGGWYLDSDEDGEFDITKDELIGETEESIYSKELTGDYTCYPTANEAKAAGYPETPTRIFAYFSKGAVVSTSYYQGAEQANCGSVFIDKPVNSPGDEVTVRAIPTDGFQFEYWSDALSMGNVVSTDNPYTFTVQGGEHLYAYFTAIDAPSVELPEEGGYKVAYLNAPWVMTDESMKNGAHIIVIEEEDLTWDDEKRVYFDTSNEKTWIDVAQINKLPTIISGKGTVNFAYKLNYGIARKTSNETLVRWSGNGVTLTSTDFYFYTFDEGLGAFLQFANTDTNIDPDVSKKVNIPAEKAYFYMSAYDLVDENGNIPTAIGLSPETFDAAITGIEDVNIETREVKGQKIYTLSGVEIKSTPEKGIYIINGKKVLIK